MAKKFKFTDLAYDNVKSIPENDSSRVEKKESYLQDIKNNFESQKESISNNSSNKIEIQQIDKKTNSNTFDFEIKQKKDLGNEEVKNVKKINYEIDYSEYDDVNDKQKVSNFSRPNNYEKVYHDEKRTQLKTYSSILNEKDSNEINRYNETLENQENLSGTMGSTFSPNKIKDLISFKEKLDVKTNIYLKSSVVIKLKELEKRTNESRSSIINKLLEFAIKNMEER